jgi:hypothetical protein
MSESHQPPGRDLLAPEYVAARQKGASAGFILRKLIWSVALLVMAGSALNGFATFAIQTGAPQQAAAAASACFQMITPYLIARAMDELTRSERVRVAKEL